MEYQRKHRWWWETTTVPATGSVATNQVGHGEYTLYLKKTCRGVRDGETCDLHGWWSERWGKWSCFFPLVWVKVKGKN